MTKRISIPLYSFAIDVVDIKKARKVDKELPEDFCGGLTFWDGGKLCVFVSTKFPSIVNNLCTHEACHCAFEILQLLDIPIGGKDNQEAFAYLCSYIADVLMDMKQKEMVRKKPVQKRKKK